jgi:hypothetical protein
MGDDLDLLDDVAAQMEDDLDMLDDVASELMSSGATEAPPAAPAPAAARRRPLREDTPPPKTWQDALSVLELSERLEFTKTISRDVSVQQAMQAQPVYSRAYREGEEGGGDGGNAVMALATGAGVLAPTDPDALFRALLQRAILVCNKSYKEYEPSGEVRALFYDQVRADARNRLDYSAAEHADVEAEPERFRHLFHQLQQIDHTMESS